MLRFLAKLIYLVHRPKIIVVTGSAGKTQTIALLYHILQYHFRIFKTTYHKNHLQGVLLTFFLSSETPFWYNFFKGIKILFSKNYPEYLILEFGLEKPGVVDKYFHWLKVDYLVITSLGKIPPFVEFFAGPENLFKEYLKFLSMLKEDAKIFINGDDYTLLDIKEKSPSYVKVLTFGLGEHNFVSAQDVNLVYKAEVGKNIYYGIKFNISFEEKGYPVFLNNLFGKGWIYASLASFLLSKIIGISVDEIIRDIESFPGLPGRGVLHKTRSGSFILDETAHGSLGSVIFALETLSQVKSKRKIFILGDLLHLGEFSFEAHSLIGEKSIFVDYFIAFGVRSHVALNKAIEMGLEENKCVKILHSDKERLIDEIRKIIKEPSADNFILITGDKELGLGEIVSILKEII
jgi:UDP-N-acetylmuramoyl-tripeptide--D-alanyl-D-alanine ligase